MGGKGGTGTGLAPDLKAAMRGLKAGEKKRRRTLQSQSPTEAVKADANLEEDSKVLVSGLDGFNPQFFESSKFNASLRSTLPRNFDVKATPKDKMKKLEKIRGELLKDLTTMEQLHKKIMNTLRQFRSSFEHEQGFFFYDRNDFIEIFGEYSLKMKTLVESTFQRWKANLSAGIVKPLTTSFTLKMTEPLVKNNF